MKTAAIIAGVMYAVICEALAFVMVGGGHGWLTPFFWGALGLIVFPLSAYSAFTATEEDTRWTLVLSVAFAAAIAADLILIERTIDEGLQYLDRVGAFSYFWIACWLGGQLPLFYALAIRLLERRRRRDA